MRLLFATFGLLLFTTAAVAIPVGYDQAGDRAAGSTRHAISAVPCVEGLAMDFHCHGVDLLAYLPLDEMGCEGTGNDLWGWTDPQTRTDYALMGCSNGTSFVDLSNPEAPVFVGRLPSHEQSSSIWRDIKVYADHAFIVSEASGHGLQVFDLGQLRDVTSPPAAFENTAHLGSFGQAHNVAINEDTGYAYVVGAGRNNPATCMGGLFMVNIQEPAKPEFAGCFSEDGYTHDTQCVIYHGPDNRYFNSEICINSNENTVTIVDVTDKSNPVMLARESYLGVGYVHQGWLTEDHRYFLLGDELDELNLGHNTRTRIWDVTDLHAPHIIGIFDSSEDAIDHNLYVMGDFVYQANYTAGLRILDLAEVADGILTEAAYFNVVPHDHEHDAARHDEVGIGFDGAWSNYPYFDSGIVIVSSRGSGGEPGGLFVVKPYLVESQITGTVTRSDSGEPVEGVLIEVSAGIEHEAVTGSDGTFAIAILPGTYAVTASKDGFVAANVSDIVVTENKPAVTDLVLVSSMEMIFLDRFEDGDP